VVRMLIGITMGVFYINVRKITILSFSMFNIGNGCTGSKDRISNSFYSYIFDLVLFTKTVGAWNMEFINGIWFHGIATFYTYFLFPFQIILVKQSNSLMLSGILQNYFYINSSCLAWKSILVRFSLLAIQE
jgi:hypothetical protein